MGPPRRSPGPVVVSTARSTAGLLLAGGGGGVGGTGVAGAASAGAGALMVLMMVPVMAMVLLDARVGGGVALCFAGAA